jgi:plastocyanin
MALGMLAALPVGAQAPVPTDEAPVDGATVDGPKKVKVKVGDNYFKPKKVTVVVGDTVVWKWVGTAIHDVVVDEGPKKFKSKKQARGKFKRKIVAPGLYEIVCTLHPGMEMTLTAEPAPPPTTTIPTAAP